MVKRITIAMNDELHERLQNVKNKINVSKLCQEAIMNRVEAVEMAKNSDLISFLKAGKEEVKKADRKLGKEDAAEYINNNQIDYMEFKAIAEFYDEITNCPPVDGEYEAIKYLLDRELSTSFWDDCFDYRLQEHLERDKTIDVDAYSYGFIERVAEVWAEIKDKL